MQDSLSLTNPEPIVRFSNSRNKWKVIVPLAVLAVFLLGYGCNRVLQRGSHDAWVLSEQLHEQMRRQDWSGIDASADPGYRNSVSQDASMALFSSIAKKLGSPVNTNQGGTTLEANASGNFITSSFETEFSQDAKGEERITWRRSDGAYRLFGYNITSNALVTR